MSGNRHAFRPWISPTRPEDEAFRAELREWLDANLPDFLDQGEIGTDHADMTRRTMERRRAWQRRLNDGRWAAINWPREWGGREATIMQNFIYSQEMANAKAPGHLQRQRHLADRAR